MIMAEPWFNEIWFGTLYGSIVGGGGGSLGGVLGALAGVLAPQGKGRGLILGGMYTMVVFGVLSLVFGLVALFAGQPYGIWFAPVLAGVIFVAVAGGLIPVIRRRYAEAEHRRLEAAAVRQS